MKLTKSFNEIDRSILELALLERHKGGSWLGQYAFSALFNSTCLIYPSFFLFLFFPHSPFATHCGTLDPIYLHLPGYGSIFR